MNIGSTNEQLRRDLTGIASDLKWSIVELANIAQRLEQSTHKSDAQALLRMIGVFKEGESRLGKHAEDLAQGRLAVTAPHTSSGVDKAK